jgi:hypothetical protein
MAQQKPDVGTAYDDPSADRQRDINVMFDENFDELYSSNETFDENFDEVYSFDFVKVKEIGTWDMSSTGSTSKDVAYSAPSGYVVTGATISIIGDDGKLYPHEIGVSSEATAWYYDYSTEVFHIVTSSSGFFYNSNFDGTSSNRGYINIHLDRAV